jgi:hypothetical protein
MRYHDAFDAFDSGPRRTSGQRAPWDLPNHYDQLRARPGEFPTQADGFSAIDRRLDEVIPAIYDDDAAAGDSRDRAGRRQSRGVLAGGVTGFLAAAVALGVANLVAAFVRPQASPVIAVGGAFIDHTPAALKNFAVEKFGENDKNMLLLGMYITIALIAIVIGMIAWRHISVGIAGIGLFGAFGAFVAYTRPDSLHRDIIPSLAGGVAGVVAIVVLVRVAARRAPEEPEEGEVAAVPREGTLRSGWTA